MIFREKMLFCYKSDAKLPLFTKIEAVQGTGQCPTEKPRLARSLRKMGRTLTCPLSVTIQQPSQANPLMLRV